MFVTVPRRDAQETNSGSRPRQVGASDGRAGREEEENSHHGVRAGQQGLRLHLLHITARSTGQAQAAGRHDCAGWTRGMLYSTRSYIHIQVYLCFKFQSFKEDIYLAFSLGYLPFESYVAEYQFFTLND